MAISLEELRSDLEKLSRDGFCANIFEMAATSFDLLTPPEDISTTECARRYRKIRTAEGSGHTLWSLDLTPYLAGPQDALDDPNVAEVIIPKPGRCGGTVAFENHLFKRMRFGPMTDVLWYLGGPDEVKSYCDKQVTPLFEDHPEISALVGEGKSDNNITKKKVSGRFLEYLAASNKTLTNRQASYIVGDEIDTFTPRMRASFLAQIRIRGRALGNRRKAGMASHPDAGWTSGIASAWEYSSRGIYVWACSECEMWSSPWPTKHWPKIPRTELWYKKLPEASADERIKSAVETAAMQCPHCGSLLSDEQRHAMSRAGQWMHRGQDLDVHVGPVGTPETNTAMGFWIHGLMSLMISNAELARELEEATIHFEKTKKVERLREILSKVFGQVFEGAGAAGEVDSAILLRRSQGEADGEKERSPLWFPVGQCPENVLFITAAVDVGHRKFDVSFRGWDIEGRSWWLDRLTIRQRLWEDGRLRDIAPPERVEDWHILFDEVLDRRFPILGKEHMEMPVAVVTVDSGDGNVTWKAREFARRAIAAGYYWGSPSNPWARVRLIKGSRTPTAPELPNVPRKVNKDELGQTVTPTVLEYDLGVFKLKDTAIERLATSDDGPGHCYFADGIAQHYFDEYFGEKLIGKEWVRNGPNESLDLFAYEEAGRQMLNPDRKDINWNAGRRPPWATPVPVSLEGGDHADEAERPASIRRAAQPKPKAKSIFDRHKELEQRDD